MTVLQLDYFDRTGNRDRLPDSDHEHYHSISYGHKQQQLCYRVWYCRHNHCDVPKWRRILGSGIQPCDYVVVIRWCGIICKDGGASGDLWLFRRYLPAHQMTVLQLDYFDRTGNRDRLPDSDHEHHQFGDYRYE